MIPSAQHKRLLVTSLRQRHFPSLDELRRLARPVESNHAGPSLRHLLRTRGRESRLEERATCTLLGLPPRVHAHKSAQRSSPGAIFEIHENPDRGAPTAVRDTCRRHCTSNAALRQWHCKALKAESKRRVRAADPPTHRPPLFRSLSWSGSRGCRAFRNL